MQAKFLCALLCFICGVTYAQQIEWNKSLGQDGLLVKAPEEKGNSWYETANSVVELADDKLLVLINQWPTLFLQRLLPNGTIDPSFGNNGLSQGYELHEGRLFRLPDGKILLSGINYTNGKSLEIRQLLSDGKPDPDYGTGGLVSIPIAGTSGKLQHAEVQGNGSVLLYVAPSYYDQPKDMPSLYRLSKEGILDHSFAGNGILQLPLDTDAAPAGITLSGTRIIYGSYDDGMVTLTAYDPDGFLDKSFGVTGKGKVAVTLSSRDRIVHLSSLKDGRIVLGTLITNYPSNDMSFEAMRLNINGIPDPTFDGDGYSTILSGAQLGGERKMLVDGFGGIWVVVKGVEYHTIVAGRLGPDGKPDASVGINGVTTALSMPGYNEIKDVQMFASGALALAGGLNTFTMEDFYFIAKLTPKGKPDSSFGTDGLYKGFIPSIYSFIADLKTVADGSVYIKYEGRGLTNQEGIQRLRPDGLVDNSFGADGMIENTYRFDTLSGKRLITATLEWSDFNNTQLVLKRFQSNGLPDNSFGLNGKKKVSMLPGFSFRNFITLPDDNMLLYGSFYDAQNQHQYLLAKFTESGDVDLTFGDAGFVFFKESKKMEVNALQVLPDGGILLAGSLALPPYKSTNAMCKLFSNGSFDQNFGHGGFLIEQLSSSTFIAKIMLQPGGNFITKYAYATDSIIYDNGNSFTYKNALAQYNAKGERQMQFGTDGTLKVQSDHHAVLATGQILEVDAEPNVSDARLRLRLLQPDGKLSTGFGNGGTAYLPVSVPPVFIWNTQYFKDKIYLLGTQVKPLENKAVIGSLVIKLEQPLVASFTLVNAATDKDIQTLANKSVINLAEIRNKAINIRANTEGAVSSVVMKLSGTQKHTQWENSAPFALFGNTGNNYKYWRAKTGTYTLQATPFTQVNGAGTAGETKTFSFKIIDSLTLSGLTLINAKTNKPIGRLQDNTEIDLDKTPLINIRAVPGVGITESVRFSVNENSSYATESVQPFALAADNKGKYYSWQVKPGTYTITATPYSLDYAAGKPGYPITVTIKVVKAGMQTGAIAQKESVLKIATPSTGLSIGAFPNPATTETMVQYSVAKTTQVTITLADQQGRMVRQVFRGAVAGGVAYQTVLPLTRLAPGVYFITLTSAAGETSVCRIVKQ